MACSLPHTDSEVKALVQRLINKDKGRQDAATAERKTKKNWGATSLGFHKKILQAYHGGIGCSSSQANCPLIEKELYQLRMDEEALKEMLEEEAMNKKAQEEKIRQEQAENNAFFLEVGVVRYDSRI
ncbi:hypothetical protein Tco_0681993 [Tanacetum coccineum]|uniref:Uncharacterized protein n=1 Tax=Tanacetum coccineum TaxID=301880 RepID=A0ABQ4XPW9_9ASTR